MKIINKRNPARTFLFGFFTPLLTGNFSITCSTINNENKNTAIFMLPLIGQFRKYSNRSTKNELIIPSQINKYLEQIQTILSSHQENPETAQKMIEEKWLEIGYDAFNISSEIYKKNTSIIRKGTNLLAKYYAKRILKKTTKFLHDFISDEKYVLAAYTIILSYYNKTAETNLSISIGSNIVYQIYKDYFKFKNEDDAKEAGN